MTFEHQIEEVYPPREDTYLLLRAALKEARADDVALEIGCGSGLISWELAPRVKSILATDINPHAARMAKAKGLEVVRADLFSGPAREVRPDTLQSPLPPHYGSGEDRSVDRLCARWRRGRSKDN